MSTGASSWPAGPKGHVLWGHVRELGRDWLGTLTRYAREYGDVVPLRFGHERVLLLNRPDYVEQVLVAKHASFAKSRSQRHWRRLLGSGLVTSEGELWRRQRRLAQPTFHRARLSGLGDVVVEHTERVVRRWEDGDVRDIHADMLRLTQDVAIEMAFGVDREEDAAEILAAITATLRSSGGVLRSLRLLIPDDLPLLINRPYLRAAARLDGVIYAMIERRRKQAEASDDLLGRLLDAQGQDGSLTDRHIRDELVSIFVAGYETSAIALAWAWYLLASHPEIEEELLAELRSILDGRRPVYGDLPNLPCVARFVTETLRLYPPVPIMSREAHEECEIGGYRVPRGTMVLMSQWVLQRDGRYFERSETFDPSRWADGLAGRLPRYAYFPFGAGPRACIGNALALSEVMLVLATMVPRFRMELVPGRDVRPRSSWMLQPEGGMWAVVRRR